MSETENDEKPQMSLVLNVGRRPLNVTVVDEDAEMPFDVQRVRVDSGAYTLFLLREDVVPLAQALLRAAATPCREGATV